MAIFGGAMIEIYYIAFAFVCVFAASVILLIGAILLGIWLRKSGEHEKRLDRTVRHDYWDSRADSHFNNRRRKDTK